MIIDADANASYAPSQRLQGVILSSFESLTNPSSLHRAGQRAKALIEEARIAVRQLVGANPLDHIIFTSGATEANNLIVHQMRHRQGEVVSSLIEHPCILQPLNTLRAEGCVVSLITPHGDGKITDSHVEPALTRGTRLVSIMAANNETGVVNDLHKIVSISRAKSPDAIIHSDVAQVIGKLPFSFTESGLDAITISGHKFGALTGVGALIVREHLSIMPAIVGGPQEYKLRAGTENVLGIISLGEAAREVVGEASARTQAMLSIRNRFECELLDSVPDTSINGALVDRLPNTSSVAIAGVRADDLQVALDREGILVSPGAACSSGKPEPSHVLRAMGQSEERVRSTIRVSFRADQTPEVASQMVATLARIVARIRNMSYSRDRC